VDETSYPERIAGWPATVSRFELPGGPLDLLTVKGLESLLDRERLLKDDAVEPPYWALVWSGAEFLAGWLDARRDLRGRSFLDAGCGLGLVSAVAARSGARVTAVDRNRDAVEFARASAARLRLPIECHVGDAAELAGGRRFDWIAAAELLYEAGDFARLAAAFASALAPAGSFVVADARRVRTDDFYAALDSLGLTGSVVAERCVDEEGTRVKLELALYRRAPR
jgi:2-polyprenyl-3-methyl-5-hydroxy-6-metoxy-1,4-benzoquinol methylase